MPYGSFTLDELREQVTQACSSGEEHIIVAYSRRSLQQTGDGHFSPIGGYHRGRDLVLILDVARFKYPPHWIPIALLHEAMSHLDPVSGLPRGFLVLSAQPQLNSVLFTLGMRKGGWEQARSYANQIPALLAGFLKQGESNGKEVAIRELGDAIAVLVSEIPLSSLLSFLEVRERPQGGLACCEEEDKCYNLEKQQVTLLNELRTLRLFQVGGPHT